jgi:hypothetical protein
VEKMGRKKHEKIFYFSKNELDGGRKSEYNIGKW